MKFDEIKASFWSRDTYGVQPALTQATVADAEKVLGLRLPNRCSAFCVCKTAAA